MADPTVVDTGSLPGLSTGEFSLTSFAVTGGTVYISAARNANGISAMSTSFVGSAAGGIARYLSLTSAKADTGVALTATATGGAFGISRTAGTSLFLIGEATSSNAKTDKAMWQDNLPGSYVAGANIPITVNAQILGTGTLTAASCTMTVAAYTEINGAEAALTVSAAQTITVGPLGYTFTVTGTGLVPGQPIAVEIVGLVTTSTGANTLEVNSVSFVA